MIWQKVNQIVMRNKGVCVYHHQQKSRNWSLTGLEEWRLAGACLSVLCCLLPLLILDLRGMAQNLLLERRKLFWLPHELGDGNTHHFLKTVLNSLWLVLKWGNNFKGFDGLTKSHNFPPSFYFQPSCRWVFPSPFSPSLLSMICVPCLLCSSCVRFCRSTPDIPLSCWATWGEMLTLSRSTI